MPFVLTATTRGDELIAPAKSVVAVSDDRGKLESLKEVRRREREAFLAANTLPRWAECTVISSESIEEVPGT